MTLKMKPISRCVITSACTGAILAFASAPTVASTVLETVQSFSEETCVEFTTDLAQYQADVSGLSETVEDFERFAGGSEVPDALFQVVTGSTFLHHDAVTFESSPASIQVFPEDFPFVVLSGGGAGGNAGIGSHAGGGKFSGFDTSFR